MPTQKRNVVWLMVVFGLVWWGVVPFQAPETAIGGDYDCNGTKTFACAGCTATFIGCKSGDKSQCYSTGTLCVGTGCSGKDEGAGGCAGTEVE